MLSMFQAGMTLGIISDTYLLLEVLTAYMESLHKLTNLWSLYYLTLSSFSYDAMYYVTGASLEYFTSREMYHLFETGIKGSFRS